MNSAVIIKSENGTVTYVVGEVVSKTKEQLQAEATELETKIAGRTPINIDALKEECNEKLRILAEELDAKITAAIAFNEEQVKETQRDTENLNNLKAVLETFPQENPESSGSTNEASTPTI